MPSGRRDILVPIRKIETRRSLLPAQIETGRFGVGGTSLSRYGIASRPGGLSYRDIASRPGGLSYPKAIYFRISIFRVAVKSPAVNV